MLSPGWHPEQAVAELFFLLRSSARFPHHTSLWRRADFPADNALFRRCCLRRAQLPAQSGPSPWMEIPEPERGARLLASSVMRRCRVLFCNTRRSRERADDSAAGLLPARSGLRALRDSFGLIHSEHADKVQIHILAGYSQHTIGISGKMLQVRCASFFLQEIACRVDYQAIMRELIRLGAIANGPRHCFQLLYGAKVQRRSSSRILQEGLRLLQIALPGT